MKPPCTLVSQIHPATFFVALTIPQTNMDSVPTGKWSSGDEDDIIFGDSQ